MWITPQQINARKKPNSKSRWRCCVEPWIYNKLPDLPGVYVVYGDGEIIYVGQSLNIRRRVIAHGVDATYMNTYRTAAWGQYKDMQVKYKVTKRYGDWAMEELRLIRRLNPKFNRRGCKWKEAPVSET